MGHWSFAAADGREPILPVEYQENLDSLLNIKSGQSKESLYETTFIKGPNSDNTSMTVSSLSAEEGILKFQAYEAERREQGIPNENFYNQIVEGNVRHMSPIVDLEKHPNFFRNAEARFEVLKAELEEKRNQEAILAKAEASFDKKSEQSKNMITLFIRSGTTVFFFAALATPSTLSLISIAIISITATYFYNNKMTAVENLLLKGGDSLLKLPVHAIKLGAKTANILPYVNIKQETIDWATELYHNHFMTKGYAKVVAQLGVAFGISLIITIFYTAAMKMHMIGFDHAAMASGTFWAYDRLWDISSWRFMEGFNLSAFLSSFKTDLFHFEIGKAFDFVLSEPIVKKALLLTAFAETWTVFRMKYRGMTSDQTKANSLGRLTGVFFSLMGPFVHKSTQVLNGTSRNPWDWSGIFVVGLVGATGLLYVLGDAQKYNQRLAKITKFTKNRTKQGLEAVRSTVKAGYNNLNDRVQAAKQAVREAADRSAELARNTTAATMMGMMELTHSFETIYGGTSKNYHHEAPALVMDRYFNSYERLSCKVSF